MAGLYLHIPFCRSKCGYCDFFSIVAGSAERQEYPGRLIQHLAWTTAQGTWPQAFSTIYFGGGTPSLLSPADISRILDAIARHCEIPDNAEVSLEINPGTVTAASLAGYRAAGINRLSLGLQTGQDRHLALLGRRHNSHGGYEAFAWARQAGFDNISLDLMFALPGQTPTDLEDDLEAFLALSPEHFSCYGLTAEPSTPLQAQVQSGEVLLPSEEVYAASFLRINERLTAAGYDHYEIANYARQGFACRHNLGYWQRQPYLGLGAGAHSFRPEGWGSRWQTPRDLTAYRQALDNRCEPAVQLEAFDRDAALRETLYLALRTRRGIQDTGLQATFGCTLEESFPEAIRRCEPWLRCDSGRWSFTPSGWLLFDHLIQHFL